MKKKPSIVSLSGSTPPCQGCIEFPVSRHCHESRHWSTLYQYDYGCYPKETHTLKYNYSILNYTTIFVYIYLLFQKEDF